MPTEKIDPETTKILTQGGKMTAVIEGEEWQSIKKRLYKKLAEFSAFGSLEFQSKSDAEIGKEIKRRHSVVELILSWIDEIEGIPAQHKANLEAFKKGQTEDYLIELE